MPTLNLDLDYFDHPKTRRLAYLLGKGAEVLPIRLWAYTGKYHSGDGRLTGYAAEEIESVVCWWGQSGALVAALLKCGFLTPIQEPEGGYAVHEWTEYQGHIAVYKERGKRLAKSRWENNKGKSDAASNAARNAGCNAGVAGSEKTPPQAAEPAANTTAETPKTRQILPKNAASNAGCNAARITARNAGCNARAEQSIVLSTPPSPPKVEEQGRGGGKEVKTQPVELPPGFPPTVDDAQLAAARCGCAWEVAEKAWNKAMSRGGRDARDVPIRNFCAYLATEAAYEADRKQQQKGNPNGNGKLSDRPAVKDRNAGTYNAGRGAEYAEFVKRKSEARIRDLQRPQA